jgi:hypothetical protein
MNSKRVVLIGGRLDGASATAEEDDSEIVINEVVGEEKMPTGRHHVYVRSEGIRYVFKEVYSDGNIVVLQGGPMDGTRTFAHKTNECLLFPLENGKNAAYDRGTNGSFSFTGEVDDEEVTND